MIIQRKKLTHKPNYNRLTEDCSSRPHITIFKIMSGICNCPDSCSVKIDIKILLKGRRTSKTGGQIYSIKKKNNTKEKTCIKHDK